MHKFLTVEIMWGGFYIWFYVISKIYRESILTRFSNQLTRIGFQELGSLSKCLWPCVDLKISPFRSNVKHWDFTGWCFALRGISWARWLLLSASVVLSLICLILATESFKISEGEIQIFEDTWISFRLFQQYCCKFSEKITTVYDPWSFSFQKKTLNPFIFSRKNSPNPRLERDESHDLPFS